MEQVIRIAEVKKLLSQLHIEVPPDWFKENIKMAVIREYDFTIEHFDKA